MNYLENGICNFKFLGRTKFYPNKINIISMCLFKIPKSYKDFNKYVNGLQNWIKFHLPSRQIKENQVLDLLILHD